MHLSTDKAMTKSCLVGGDPESGATKLFWGDSHSAALLPAIDVDGRSQYKDADHLSDVGSARLSPLFAPLLLGTNQN